MKTIISLICLLGSIACSAQEFKVFEPYRDQQVTSYLLENAKAQLGLDEYEVQKQQLFISKVKEALEKVKLPNTSVVIAFYEDEAVDYMQPYLLPKIMTNVETYVIRIRRSYLLASTELILSHLVYYTLSGIKNGDMLDKDGKPVDDNEKSRRAEYTVYKTVGWEKYKEFALESFDPDSKKSDEKKRKFLKEQQQWLGIWDENSVDGKPKP